MTQKLNCVELLRKTSSSHKNGCWQISGQGITWKIYLEQGQLKGAANSIRLSIALDYHLRKLGFSKIPSLIKSIPASGIEINNQVGDDWLEKGSWIPCLSWLVNHDHLTIAETDQILMSLTEEALETCLWLGEGQSTWLKDCSLSEQVTQAGFMSHKVDLIPLLQKFQERLEKWQQLKSIINSPYQRLFLNKQQNNNQTPAPIIAKLAKFLKGLSFRELGIILNQEDLKVAHLLAPYIGNGVINLETPQFPFKLLPNIPSKVIKNKRVQVSSSSSAKQEQENNGNIVINSQPRFKIACIDDSPIILSQMQRFLGENRFEIIMIEDPIEAASILFKIKPNLTG
ncbi:MAG: hypothetical protein QNJ60_11060 [Xenococcaceae cyanobacterium MO_188.B19]|nr:hypothetical protein [Xenococcaceae cyanobacterium MO_188.B19]